MKIPDQCAPATYRVVREYFVANYLDGIDEGVVTAPARDLANSIAELFSCDQWRETFNRELFRAVEAERLTGLVNRLRSVSEDLDEFCPGAFDDVALLLDQAAQRLS